ncbi:hypothetical protein GUJ93_ZPchr0007g3275 [Zizania palustris]|uniref:Uncharacterized protein n=1 Tax=Zizania palustris TaxID=103762 RepID=A0A8J5VSZ6_ZIZPA|nr:hypothetical protein GUJ93_ZPchr0007g3275 [Zizania palustris]
MHVTSVLIISTVDYSMASFVIRAAAFFGSSQAVFLQKRRHIKIQACMPTNQWSHAILVPEKHLLVGGKEGDGEGVGGALIDDSLFSSLQTAHFIAMAMEILK